MRRRACRGDKWLQKCILFDRVEESRTLTNEVSNLYIEDGFMSRDTEARISSGYLVIALVALQNAKLLLLFPNV